MKPWFKNIMKALFGLLILIILFYKVGFGTISENLRDTDLQYVAYILIFYLVLWGINAFNIFILTMPFQKPIRYFHVYQYSMVTWSLSHYVPGPIAEASMMYLLKNHDVRYGESAAVIVMDKLIALVVNSLFAMVGFILILERTTAIELIVVSLGLLIMIVFILYSGWVKDIIKRYILRKYSPLFKGFSTNLQEYIQKNRKETIFNLFVSIIKVPTISLIIYFGFLSLHSPFLPSLSMIMVINSAISIISFLPITVAGLGVRETLAVFFYGAIGIPATVVTSAYFIFLLMRYCLSAILLFVFGTLHKQLDLKEIKNILRTE